MENYAEHDGEGIAVLRGCFLLREGGLNEFLDVYFLVSRHLLLLQATYNPR